MVDRTSSHAEKQQIDLRLWELSRSKNKMKRTQSVVNPFQPLTSFSSGAIMPEAVRIKSGKLQKE